MSKKIEKPRWEVNPAPHFDLDAPRQRRITEDNMNDATYAIDELIDLVNAQQREIEALQDHWHTYQDYTMVDPITYSTSISITETPNEPK